MRLRAVGLVRRYWRRGVCYFVAGLSTSVVVGWCVRGTRTAPTDVTAFERGGLHLIVLASAGRGASDVTFISCADSTSSERMAAQMRAARGLKSADEKPVPRWALSALDEHARQLLSPAASPVPGMTVTAIGWPCLSMKLQSVSAGSSGWVGSVVVSSATAREEVPVPMWGGLLVNALFFSPVAFVVHWTWLAWVRRLRASSGQCRACGYDRRGLASGEAVCPECGAVPRGGK